ncbi:MAG: TM2 domain-containing protein [Flavobacteriaceae bacterium]
MSDDNKDLNDKAEEAFENAKDSAEEAAEEAQDTAEEAASDFKEEAKKTAEEFKEGLKDVGGDNKKILAGVLAIILGSLGIHKFILGYQKEGFILLGASIIGFVLSCIGIGVFILWITGLIGIIEGIIYLTKSDEEFYNTYQAGNKPWF